MAVVLHARNTKKKSNFNFKDETYERKMMHREEIITATTKKRGAKAKRRNKCRQIVCDAVYCENADMRMAYS